MATHCQTKRIGVVMSPAPLHYPAHSEASEPVGRCSRLVATVSPFPMRKGAQSPQTLHKQTSGRTFTGDDRKPEGRLAISMELVRWELEELEAVFEGSVRRMVWYRRTNRYEQGRA